MKVHRNRSVRRPLVSADGQISERLGKPVHVITHHESGLPRLRYFDAAHRRRHVGDRNQCRDDRPDVDLNNLGPAARAWYGATTQRPLEKQ